MYFARSCKLRVTILVQNEFQNLPKSSNSTFHNRQENTSQCETFSTTLQWDSSTLNKHVYEQRKESNELQNLNEKNCEEKPSSFTLFSV